jgi:LysM repeat protein
MTPGDPVGSTNPVQYTVKSGDTLTAIASKFGSSAKAIADFNHVQDPNLIHIGQVLNIPPSDPVQYVVESGDTLTAIASKFGSTVTAIADYNHITDPNLIYVGQVLKIPK